MCLEPVNLKCEFYEKAFGVDVNSPCLSWIIEDNTKTRGLKQTAYQILVSTTLDKLKQNEGDLWNSGKIQTDQMGHIIYSGKPLQSSQKYWWKVKIWNQKREESVWSESAYWVMGILKSNDWNAKWISAKGAEKYALKYKWAMKDFNKKEIYNEPQPNAPKDGDPNYSSMLLRKEFEVRPDLTLAVLHISGLGHYELSLNGYKVGDYLLTAGWTNYNKTVLYDTYELTQHLKSGSNVLGILLGNGMYNIQPDSETVCKIYKYIRTHKSNCPVTSSIFRWFNTDHCNRWFVEGFAWSNYILKYFCR